jgi:hypothetical protein
MAGKARYTLDAGIKLQVKAYFKNNRPDWPPMSTVEVSILEDAVRQVCVSGSGAGVESEGWPSESPLRERHCR